MRLQTTAVNEAAACDVSGGIALAQLTLALCMLVYMYMYYHTTAFGIYLYLFIYASIKVPSVRHSGLYNYPLF